MQEKEELEMDHCEETEVHEELLRIVQEKLPKEEELYEDNLSRSDLWTKCPEVGSLRCFPSRGIPFRTVIWFSRCCPSMN